MWVCLQSMGHKLQYQCHLLKVLFAMGHIQLKLTSYQRGMGSQGRANNERGSWDSYKGLQDPKRTPK